mgnify:FL=1
MKNIILFSLIAITVSFAKAQVKCDLTPAEIESAKQQVRNKVTDFQFQLEILSDKNNQWATRQSAVKISKSLFYNNGGTFDKPTYYYGRIIIQKDTCIMEQKSISGYRSESWVCRYLDRLGATSMQLKITSADEVRVDTPYKTGENQYTCVAHLYQKYEKRRTDGSYYIDYTKKRISAVIEIREYFDGYQNVKKLVIKLDDCEVEEVTPYYNN